MHLSRYRNIHSPKSKGIKWVKYSLIRANGMSRLGPVLHFTRLQNRNYGSRMGELEKDRGTSKGWWAQTCSWGLWTLPGDHQGAPGANPATCRDRSSELDGKDLKGVPQKTMWTRRIRLVNHKLDFGGKCHTQGVNGWGSSLCPWLWGIA